MATTVYNVEQVTLQDGTTVELKPANIKTLREFMEQLEKMDDVKSLEGDNITTQLMDIMLSAAAICLKSQKPEYWDEKEKKPTDAYEEAMDIQTMYKVIELCGGIKLNDPEALPVVTETPLPAVSGAN